MARGRATPRASCVTLGVLLVYPHLAAVDAPAPAADDGCVGCAVGAEAGALLGYAAPVLAPPGTAALRAV